jgi:phosphohistidine phosphatase SixA
VRPYHRKLSTEPMRVLVRHADAGDRREWTGPDELRALSPLGYAQAEELADNLAQLPVLRILSGPAVRCRQTVLPLARELSLPVQPCELLGPDADPLFLAGLLSEDATRNTVVCTHRETLVALFDLLTAAGSGPIEGAEMPLAGVWLLHPRPRLAPRVRYLPSAVPGAQPDLGPAPVA